MILGIDTTFHTTGLALVDSSNRVIFDRSIAINFSNQDADKFFSAHIKNLTKFISLISEKEWQKINLISVVNKEGAFHSLPMGVMAAYIIGTLKNKKVIGVDHEIAHLYSNWLEREEEDFNFPIVSLSVSGAHTVVYFQKDHQKINKLASVFWNDKLNSFGGIAALFDDFCHKVRIKIKKTGQGGVVLSNLAQKGERMVFNELSVIKSKHDKGVIIISGINRAIKDILLNYRKDLANKKFQQNLSLNFLDHIFRILACELIKLAKFSKVKEIHLVGGVSANSIFKEILKNISIENKFVFKSPLRKKFCGDNAAMVAVRGKYKNLSTQKQESISVFPSRWYYNYYFKNYLKDKKVK
ncbi:MAG: hypothetical protein ABIC36_01655 [bacterium]